MAIQATLQIACANAEAKAAEFCDKAEKFDQSQKVCNELKNHVSALEQQNGNMQQELKRFKVIEDELTKLRDENNGLQKKVEQFPLQKKEELLAMQQKHLDETAKLRDELVEARESLAKCNLQLEKEKLRMQHKSA